MSLHMAPPEVAVQFLKTQSIMVKFPSLLWMAPPYGGLDASIPSVLPFMKVIFFKTTLPVTINIFDADFPSIL